MPDWLRKSTQQNLGYTLYPPRREHEPGYARLDVALRDLPTEHHFDPETLEMTVYSSEGGVETVVFEHPWREQLAYQACIGPIYIMDRKNKHVAAFTFGGTVQIDVFDDYTLLKLESAAPILIKDNFCTPDGLLVDEAEIVLAQRRVAYGINQDEYDRRLAQADPLALYYCVLKRMTNRMDTLPACDNRSLADLKHLVRNEIVALQGLLQGSTRVEIEDLL